MSVASPDERGAVSSTSKCTARKARAKPASFTASTRTRCKTPGRSGRPVELQEVRFRRMLAFHEPTAPSAATVTR
eukprot:253304-Prymnesium_polylepis.2